LSTARTVTLSVPFLVLQFAVNSISAPSLFRLDELPDCVGAFQVPRSDPIVAQDVNIVKGI
jgi:hypothetical protein